MSSLEVSRDSFVLPYILVEGILLVNFHFGSVSECTCFF